MTIICAKPQKHSNSELTGIDPAAADASLISASVVSHTFELFKLSSNCSSVVLAACVICLCSYSMYCIAYF